MYNGLFLAINGTKLAKKSYITTILSLFLLHKNEIIAPRNYNPSSY